MMTGRSIPFPPRTPRGRRSLSGTGVGLLAILLLPAPYANTAEVFDLRNGVRTWLFGGGFGGSPPTGDAYGWAMAFGDIDADGYTDVLSSSANSEGPNDENAAPESDVYLIFGRPRADIDSVYAVDVPGVADIVFYRGGFSMACGDVDSDGYDDVVLAEVFARDGIYIVFGGPRDQLRTVYNFKADRPDYTPPDVHVVGSTWPLGGAVIDVLNAGYDHASRTLVAGDINDDGFDDIVFGNYFASDPPGGPTIGAAYIVFGRSRAEFPSVIDVDYASALPHPDVIIWGECCEQYPFTLAIGDLDGDGVDDLLASVTRGSGEDNIYPLIGEIHGWWGKRDWKPVYATQIEEFDFALHGGGKYNLGYRLATGDLDGDGRDDLIVGSPSGDGNVRPPDRLGMGEYRVLFGRPRALWPRWGDAVDMTDVLILGAQSGEAFSSNGPQEWGIAFSLATGNRDGDAYDDLLIGAGHGQRPLDQVPEFTGKAYLLRGRRRGAWQPFIDLRDGYDLVVYGAEYSPEAGFYDSDLLGFVTGMADLDGNGKDEMFIAAPFADGPNNSISDCGEIYVIYDSDTGAATGQGSSGPPLARAALLPNHPNPFANSTFFRLRAPRGESVSLTVYDVLGREVARPLVSEQMEREETDVPWTAYDVNGRPLPSGVYFVKLRAGTESHSRKVMLVR